MMKAITKKAAIAVLGLAVMGGFSVNEASAGFLGLGGNNHQHNGGLLGQLLGGVGDVVHNTLTQIGDAVDNKLDHVAGVVDQVVNPHNGGNGGSGLGDILDGVGDIVEDVTGGVGDVVEDITHPTEPVVQLNLGVVTNLLAGVGIDLSHLGIDLEALSDSELDALLNIHLLGFDLETLLDAEVLAGLGILTDDGLNVEALLCAIVDGSLTVEFLDQQVAAIDVFASLGIDLMAILDENGLALDLDLACGCTGGNGPDSPTDPNNPNNPNDPNNPGTSNPVPEPATAMLGLMGAGSMVLAMSRRRKA